MTNDNKNPQVISRPRQCENVWDSLSMALIQWLQSNPLSQQKLPVCAADMDNTITNLAGCADNTCSGRRKNFGYKSWNFDSSNLSTSPAGHGPIGTIFTDLAPGRLQFGIEPISPSVRICRWLSGSAKSIIMDIFIMLKLCFRVRRGYQSLFQYLERTLFN